MITGESMPAEKQRGDKVIGERSMGQVSLMRAARSGLAAKRFWRRSCAWSAKRNVAVRPFSGWRTSVVIFFVPGCRGRRRDHICRVGVWGPDPPSGLRHRQCRGRADHCLPLRAWAWLRPWPSWWVSVAAPAAGVLIKNAEALETLEESRHLLWTRPARSRRESRN